MPKRRFDFTKKNKRSGKVENVGYLDLEQDEEQSRCSLYFYGDIVSATWERDSCCRRKEDGQNNRRPLPLRRIRACTVRAVIKNKDIKKRTTPISGCRPCVIMNL